MKVYWKLRPIFDMHHAQESQISRVAPIFAASFFLPLFSYSFFLGKTDSYRKFLFSSFLAFSPFSEVVSHDVECFIVATSKKTDDPWKANIWESSGGDQNNEKRGQFVMSSETELLFLSITKRIEKARYSSKSFTERVWLDHHRYDNKWRLRS